MFFMFPKTVKFKAPGMFFFRRLHRCYSIRVANDDPTLWYVLCETGAMAYIPKTAVVIRGKKVPLL